MVDPTEPQARWHFDRTVNVTVLLGFLGMIASGSYYAAATNFRLDQLEKSDSSRAPQAERLIRLEEQMHGITVSLEEIKRLLRSASEQRR